MGAENGIEQDTETQKPRHEVHPVVHKHVQLLQKQGYMLDATKTIHDYPKLMSEMLGCTSYDTPYHLLLVLGQCLPIDFQTQVIDPIYIKRKKDASLRYAEHGTIMGDVYQKMREFLIVYQNCVERAFLACCVGAKPTLCLPQELISLTREYFVGPLAMLSAIVSEIGDNILSKNYEKAGNMFGGHYELAMSYDKRNFDSMDDKRDLIQNFQHHVEMTPRFLTMSPEEQHVEMLKLYLRQHPYPYPKQLSLVFSDISNVQTFCSTLYFNPPPLLLLE